MRWRVDGYIVLSGERGWRELVEWLNDSGKSGTETRECGVER